MVPRTAVLMCHAPIVIPAIGAERGSDCVASTKAMEAAAQAVVASGVGTLLVVSPHSPRHSCAFGYATGETLRGDFQAFGIRGFETAFRNDVAAAATVARHAERAGLAMAPTKAANLDHGALVPLWFLEQAGFKGRIGVFGFPWEEEPDACQRFGKAMVAAMAALERPWALVASGDMSHALQEGAPGGFHPRAHTFDEAVVNCVKEGRIGDVSRIEAGLRQLAAEDVVDSLEVAEGTLDGDHSGLRFLSYEAPFGVGYLIAVLKGGAA
jgi:aromatic ring-opening dioxygenase LigB subunit